VCSSSPSSALDAWERTPSLTTFELRWLMRRSNTSRSCDVSRGAELSTGSTDAAAAGNEDGDHCEAVLGKVRCGGATSDDTTKGDAAVEPGIEWALPVEPVRLGGVGAGPAPALGG
jgi:hypothetical protein